MDYLCAVQALAGRRRRLIAVLEETVPQTSHAEASGWLRCFRGINTLTAAGLCAEVGDSTRFAKPALLSGFLGVVPSECTEPDHDLVDHAATSARGAPRWTWWKPAALLSSQATIDDRKMVWAAMPDAQTWIVAAAARERCPLRNWNFERRCRERIRSLRPSSMQRTRSGKRSSASLGTNANASSRAANSLTSRSA